MTCVNNNNCNNNCNSNGNNGCNNNCNNNCNNISPVTNIIREKCCVGQTGCFWNGELDSLVLEPIYVQKIYDSALFNMQGISYAQGLHFSPKLPCGATVVGINYINISKYFDPTDCSSTSNFRIKPETTLQGAQFVQCGGEDEKVVGPDGKFSEKIIYVDTSCCDALGKGTPIFGSQNIVIKGMVKIEMEVRYTDPDCCGGCPNTQVLSAYYTITAPGCGGDLILTNFFELCIPSIYDGAFLPRFTELCNASLTGRLMTSNLTRDICVCDNGTVSANIIISICITCEKKVVMPAQLCVLSTGYTQLSAETGMVCPTFPTLFPRQIDENSLAAENGNSNCNTNGNNSNCSPKRNSCS